MRNDVTAQDRMITVGVQFDRRQTVDEIEANTTWVREGRLAIGVEFRLLTDEILAQSYTVEQMEIVNRLRPAEGYNTRGVAIHVHDASTGAERLRFDCFPEDPHYHYLPDGEWQYIVAYDAEAGDDFLEWTIGRLRRRLPSMLRFAVEYEFADAIENIDMERVADEVVRVSEAALAKAH